MKEITIGEFNAHEDIIRLCPNFVMFSHIQFYFHVEI